MNKSFVSIQISPTISRHFEVPKEVQMYLIQLELALKDGDKGRERLSKTYKKFKL